MRFWLKVTLSLIWFVLLFEVLGRACVDLKFLQWGALDERALLFAYDEEIGWIPKPFVQSDYDGPPTFFVESNSLGFRDKELAPEDTRRRLLVIGDSFVWGHSVSQSDLFTTKLQRRFPDISVVNAGVSGYGTDQEYLFLKRHLARIRPEVTLLVFNPNNDYLDNQLNVRYGGYYKPYFEEDALGVFAIQGQPVPKSPRFYMSKLPRWLSSMFTTKCIVTGLSKLRSSDVHQVAHDPTLALLDEIKNLLGNAKSRFVVGLIDPDPLIEKWCASKGVPCISLFSPQRFDFSGSHWTPAGHEEVAGIIAARMGEMMP